MLGWASTANDAVLPWLAPFPLAALLAWGCTLRALVLAWRGREEAEN